MLPDDEAELTMQYIAHLIQVDDAKRRGEFAAPYWTKTDEAEKQQYMNRAQQRLINWRERESK